MGRQDDVLGMVASGRISRPRPKVARRLDVRSPFDGKTIGAAPDLGSDALIECFEAASRALNELSDCQVIQEKLRNWARKIDLQREQLARIVSLETGKPIRFARIEVLTALTILDALCKGPAIPVTRDRGSRRIAFLISNWCDPVLTMVRETVAALRTGRALVIKPSSRASLVSLTLASYWNDGVETDALLKVASSTDAIAMLRVAVRNSRVDEVRFRGTHEVGAYVSRACLDAKIPVTIFAMERVALVVDTQSDIDHVCDSIVNRVFFQPLLSGAERVSRLYVSDSVAASIVPKLASRVARLCSGNPLNDQTDVGPVIDDVAAAITREHIEDAIADGATLLGKELPVEGRQLRPMILDQVQPFMRVCNEELEGPLLPVVRFKSLAEVERDAGNALIWSEKGGQAGWWGRARRNVQHEFLNRTVLI